jgi:hypothetical protein
MTVLLILVDSSLAFALKVSYILIVLYKQGVGRVLHFDGSGGRSSKEGCLPHPDIMSPRCGRVYIG